MRGAKAYVAFDLDLTLGCFQHTNPLGQFWGPEMLERSSLAQISPRLLAKLESARSYFANQILKSPELLNVVLRENVGEFIEPLLYLRRKGKLGAVIIYSNSSVTSSLELAANLIQSKFRGANGLFSLLADATHPSRILDYPATVVAGRSKNDKTPIYSAEPVDPLKQIQTLQRLFREATGERGLVVKPKQILFVDDRRPKHALLNQEPEGLTYIVPSPYITQPTEEERERLFFMAFDALQHEGLLTNDEYLESPFFNRVLYDGTRIRGFTDLFMWVWDQMLEKRSGLARSSFDWEEDSESIRAQMQRFLENIQSA